MKKEFNITGTCRSEEHYMMDDTRRFNQILNLNILLSIVQEEKRMDIVVTYEKEKYVIELKMWQGEKSHEKGLNQLVKYLENYGLEEGWLLIFDDRKQPS